jgi:hypothetical protein
MPYTKNDPRLVIGRGLAKGVANTADFLLGAVTKPVQWAANQLDQDDNSMALAGLKRIDDVLDASDALDKALGYLDADEEPTNALMRGTEQTSEVLGSVLGGVGLGRWLIQKGATKAGQFLAAQPGLQLTGALSGEAAREVVEQAGGGAGAQLTASLIGSLTPTGAVSLIRKIGVGGARNQQALQQVLLDE